MIFNSCRSLERHGLRQCRRTRRPDRGDEGAFARCRARDNATINNLLPERFDTDRQHQMAKAAMARENISYEEARTRQI